MPVAANFSLSAWLSNRAAVAARAPAGLFRGLLTRTLTLPASVIALALQEDGSRRTFAEGAVVDLDGVDRLVLVKAEPLEPSFEFIGLPDRDGLPTEVRFRLRVVPGRTESDLAAIDARLIGAGADEADRSALRDVLGPAATEAVRGFLAERSAAQMVDAPGAAEALAARVLPACAAAVFGVGFEATALEQAEFDSPAYRERAAIEARSRRAAAEIELREQLERRKREGRLAKVAHLEELAERIRALRDRFPQASLESLLRRVELEQNSPVEELSAGLFPQLQPCRRLYAAAGGSVLVFEPPRWSRPAERIDVPTELGAVRSVRVLTLDHGRRELAVGCRLGVYLMPLPGGPARSFRLGAAAGRREPRGGVNSSTAAGGRLFASHSEIGLAAWPVDEAAFEARLIDVGFGPVSAVRGVCADERLGVVVSWGSRVLRLHPEDLLEDPAAGGGPFGLRIGRLDGAPGRADELICGDAEITALLVADGMIVAGDASGRLLRRRAESAGAVEELERGPHKVYGLARALLGGTPRLLIGDNGYALRARDLNGTRELQYRVGRSPIGFVAGSSDYVFALDSGQSRIFVWNADDPSQPSAEIPVRALLQHSATDLTVLTDEPQSADESGSPGDARRGP